MVTSNLPEGQTPIRQKLRKLQEKPVGGMEEYLDAVEKLVQSEIRLAEIVLLSELEGNSRTICDYCEVHTKLHNRLAELQEGQDNG